MMITLNDQQAAGLEKVKAWYRDSRDFERGLYPYDQGFGVFRWFGYAGTGKTFTAARIPEALGLTRVVFGTYTGKAASVLRRSLAGYGVDAPVTTIHSAIYYPTTSKAAADALDECREEISELKSRPEVLVSTQVRRLAELEAQLPKLEADAKRVRWEFNPESDWASAGLIILDEVSMVNAKLAADIESYGVPILVLGDPAQLPPVEGGGYYTDAAPDHLLTDIQRQALDSPVIDLATRVRESTDAGLGLTGDDWEAPSVRAAMAADVVLVWSNKRRWAMINAIRKIQHGLSNTDPRLHTPLAGDIVMVLTNNKDMAVFNGELFTVADVRPGTLGPTLLVVSETGSRRELPTFYEGFGGQEAQQRAKASGMGMRGNRVLTTFAQAITVHKAQGSQWPHVYVVNETPQMVGMVAKRQGVQAALTQGRQWLYTAATRAQEKVTITQPR